MGKSICLYIPKCVSHITADERYRKEESLKKPWNKMPQNKPFCGLLKITTVINAHNFLIKRRVWGTKPKMSITTIDL